MAWFCKSLLVSCVAVGIVGAASAQEAVFPDFPNYVPSVAPARVSPDLAPTIDGDLSDPIWAQATQITDFYSVEPIVGTPTEDTIVYMAYDENALYVAVHAFDSNPDEIITRIMERDGEVWRDDMLRFYIDPFNTGLGGFGFDVNAAGARLDRILQRGGPPIVAWDTIWAADGQVTDDGWTAEIEIPFRSISFDPESDEGWGLLITRELAHKNEQIRWASIDPGVQPFDFRQPGRLVGISDIEEGMGLDIEVLGKIEASRDWERPRDDDLIFAPSANIYYKFTPSLTGLLTLNADFSDTPLDARQINTGRFSIFLPETRDFFLQDAAVFEFAGQTFGRGQSNGQPFFSRRIGIVDGTQVDMKGGIKLSGELNGVEVGLLTTRMGSAANIEEQTLSVGRVSIDVLDNSRLGFIATNGDPRGLTDNTVLGTDFIYRDRNFMGGGLLQATAFYLRSQSDDVEDDSYGVLVQYPNDKWGWNASFREIGEDYRPALGFVNRPGTQDSRAGWHRRFRQTDSWLQYWQVGTEHNYITDLDGNLETRRNQFNFEFVNSATDEFKFSVFENLEVVNTPFSLPRGIIIPAGEYHNDGASASIRSSFTRPYGTNSEIRVQDYFGGERVKVKLATNFQPSPYWSLKLEYDRDQISVPNGDVTVQVYSVENVINLSPDISVNTQVQYDNISEGMSIFSRLRWEVRPETEVFVSLGHGAVVDYDEFPREFESVQSQFVVRFGNRFQF